MKDNIKLSKKLQELYNSLSNEDKEDFKESFCLENIDCTQDCFMSLYSFTMYVHEYIIKDECNFHEKKKEKNLFSVNECVKTKTLKYIFTLLKNDELVMLLHRYSGNKNKPKLMESKVSSFKTVSRDINLLKEMWNKYPQATETATWFVIPKHKAILGNLENSRNPKNKTRQNLLTNLKDTLILNAMEMKDKWLKKEK